LNKKLLGFAIIAGVNPKIGPCRKKLAYVVFAKKGINAVDL
jgi:hypothetical protein